MGRGETGRRGVSGRMERTETGKKRGGTQEFGVRCEREEAESQGSG